MSRVEQFEDIRKDLNEEGMSVRGVADKHRVHRRKVRQARESATPPERKVPERESPALGEFKPIIREWLEADQLAPRKQRHTAHRIWQRLRDEHGARIAESTVRCYVAEVRFELDNVLARVTVPQQHGPGEEAEVDWWNRRRLLEPIGMIPPAEAEALYYSQTSQLRRLWLKPVSLHETRGGSLPPARLGLEGGEFQ